MQLQIITRLQLEWLVIDVIVYKPIVLSITNIFYLSSRTLAQLIRPRQLNDSVTPERLQTSERGYSVILDMVKPVCSLLKMILLTFETSAL